MWLLVPVQFGTASFSLSSISEKPEQAVQTFMQRPIGNAKMQQTAPAEQPTQNVTPLQTQKVPAQSAQMQNAQNHPQTPSAAALQTMHHVLAHETTHYRHGDHIWAINGRFLSLAVNAESAVSEGNSCYAVNIDIMTGERVSDDAVYGSLGLSYMDYLALAEKALLNRFVTPFESNPMPDGMMEQVNDCIARTANEGNLRSATPYLDSEGKLRIWGRVYQLAGAAYQEYLLPLTDYDLSPVYSEYIDE